MTVVILSIIGADELPPTGTAAILEGDGVLGAELSPDAGAELDSSEAEGADVVEGAAPGAEDPGAEGADCGDAGAEEPGAEEPGAEGDGAGEPGAEDADSGEAGAEEPGAEEPGAEEPGAEEPGAADDGAGEPGTEDADTGDAGAEEAGAEATGTEAPGEEPAGAELPVTEATGHTVVLTAMIEVTTDIERAGQLVTVGAQLVMVETMVLNTVDVVIGVPFEYKVRPLPWVPGL